jgi:S1-C subfamily serine protease
MLLKSGCFGFLIALAMIATATAQSIDRGSVWAANKQAVVKISVTGRNAAGASVPMRKGSGVIVRSNGVIVTALHVIGDDAEWMETPNGRERRIEITGLDGNGIERNLGTASARAVPSYDLAILMIAASNLPAAPVADAPPADLASVVAIIWDPDSHQPEPVSADLVPTDRSRFRDNLTLRLAVIEGHSGSGVFNAENKLVGIITNQLDANRALAAPAFAFSQLLPPPLRARPTERDVAQCEAEARNMHVGRQAFSVQNGVRCQNMGDSQESVVQYNAPPGYSIVGQVQRVDETNYGSVGALQYVRDGARVTSVSANLRCSTPNRPFGPGGWSNATLNGFIEKVLAQDELVEIRRACLAQ